MGVWRVSVSWVLIGLFVAACLWLVGQGLVGQERARGRIYELPFLAGATFLGFLLPQLPGVAADPYVPVAAFEKMIFFTILCVIAIGVGWASGARPLTVAAWSFDERWLLWMAAALSLLGAFFSYKIDQLPPELVNTSMWTGLPVAYLFFARAKLYGFAIATLCFCRRPSIFAFAIIIFDVMYLLQNVVLHGRRADTAEFVLIIALSVWFARGRPFPRTLAVIGIMIGTLFIHSVGEYRTLTVQDSLMSASTLADRFSTASNIEWINNISNMIEYGGLEARNAVHSINFIDKNMSFDYGAANWNILVFNYIPAQVVGQDMKQAFYIPVTDQGDPYYDQVPGSTNTGMVDAFGSFWYFGWIKFFLAAYIMACIYRTAVDGYMLFQLLYMLSVAPALQVITHQTQNLPTAWVHMAIFLLPALALARVRPGWRETNRNGVTSDARRSGHI